MNRFPVMLLIIVTLITTVAPLTYAVEAAPPALDWSNSGSKQRQALDNFYHVLQQQQQAKVLSAEALPVPHLPASALTQPQPYSKLAPTPAQQLLLPKP